MRLNRAEGPFAHPIHGVGWLEDPQRACGVSAAPPRIIDIDHDLEVTMKARRSPPNHPTTPSRRWHVVATALVAALAAVPSVPANTAAEESPPGPCFWDPAAAVLPFGPELAATVRMVGTDVEVLHRVRCTDHTERWLWMPASYDGSPWK